VAPRRRTGPRPARALAGLAVLILVMLISITGKDTFSPSKWHQQFQVGLGLDLSSGTQVVLQAHTAKGQPPSSGAMQQAISVLESRVNGTGNSAAQVQQQGSDLINVSVPGGTAESTIKLVSTTAQLRFRQVLLVEPYSGSAARPAAHPSGSATPHATPTGSASAAGKSTSPKASTAALSARHASPSASPTATPASTASATPTASASPGATPSPTATGPTTYGDPSKVNAATKALFAKLVCKPGPNSTTVNDSWKQTVGYGQDGVAYNDVNSQIVSCDPTGMKYVLAPAVFEGQDITSVNTGILQNSTQWVVNLTLNNKAASAFGKLTTDQYNTYFSSMQSGDLNAQYLDSTAVVLDGNVQSAPATQQPITAGNVQITGPAPAGFTQDQAEQLANVLKFGALPLNFTTLSVNSTSPELGHSSLEAGLIAGIIGLGLVVIYMFLYYRGLGLVSVSSLLIAALLAYLSVVLLTRYQNFHMELSGIAGLIVAIGITADSFIVFFERLRDEVRDGKTLRPAVESGWKRARRTILVSDTVSFLAAVLLYKFAVSDVQGFAYTLGLTTLIDVIVVFLFTKPMVTVLAGTKFFGGGHRWSGLDPERLGARTPWRSGVRRTVRTQRPAAGTRTSATSTTTSREA
jgi:preprotein translocase subunit SecD